MTSHPEFTVLLARQRSGTNALRSVLRTHPEIFCFDEVFKLGSQNDADPLVNAGNYFTFLEEYCAGDVRKAFPDRHDETFTAYLAYLRERATKRLIVVDVKYNSTHHLTDVWREIAEPTLFRLLKSHGIGVLHLTRRNLLRCLISSLKAWRSRRYIVRGEAAPRDGSISLPPEWALKRVEVWAAEDERVGAAFDGYEFYKRVEYADLFPDMTGVIDHAGLLDLAGWFGVADEFTNQASVVKLSSLPLQESIENFEDLGAVFRGTSFEACLDDEPAYRPAVRHRRQWLA